MAAEHVIHGRAAAAIRHMGDFHAGLLGEHRHGEMAERADADRGVFDRAGLAFRRRNDVGKGLERPAGIGRDHIGRGADQEHRHQILLDVELRLFENGGNHRVRIERHQKRRAIRRALGDLGGAERTGGARLVLDQHDAAELGLQMGLQQPGQRVGGASGRKRHHQRQDLGRLRQRRRDARKRPTPPAWYVCVIFCMAFLPIVAALVLLFAAL